MTKTKSFKFKSEIKELGQLPEFTQEEVKNEPMLFNCSFYAAYTLGGTITKKFLNTIEKRFHSLDDIVIDSRVHMYLSRYIWMQVGLSMQVDKNFQKKCAKHGLGGA
jgi:hypothetical protein